MPQKSLYPNLPEEFPDLVLAARKGKGWSQRELADRAGSTFTFVSQLETRKRNFTYEKALKFKEVLGIDIELPKPDLSQRNLRRERPKYPVKSDRFKVVIEGEVIEILMYRNLGPVKKATRL